MAVHRADLGMLLEESRHGVERARSSRSSELRYAMISPVA